MDYQVTDDIGKIQWFWREFFKGADCYQGVLVSANCFFGRLQTMQGGETLNDILQCCNIRELYPFISYFKFHSVNEATVKNHYSVNKVSEFDQFLSDRFHRLIPQIVNYYKNSFIDQLRCIHFLGMAGNESIMLYPSQTKRLQNEKVKRIAGEIRNIPSGFGEFRFHAPSVHNLPVLLSVYTKQIDHLLKQANKSNIYYLVSFAQYYFAVLHPFYERCGRTSEDLMYLIFEQAGIAKRYISCTGSRSSSIAYERMELINHAVEDFNRRIALGFGLDTGGISKTPDIYRFLTLLYFPEYFETVYANITARPFYYNHPITSIILAYYFLMEALLVDELMAFDLNHPSAHIMRLGDHLRENGAKEYCYHSDNHTMPLNLQDILSGLSDCAENLAL